MLLRVFKTRVFIREAKRLGVGNSTLLSAIHEIEHGRVDAKLGAGVFKQRVARPGKGKSGGFRITFHPMS